MGSGDRADNRVEYIFVNLYIGGWRDMGPNRNIIKTVPKIRPYVKKAVFWRAFWQTKDA